MPPEIRVTLPDGSEKRIPAGSTGADLAKAIGPGLAKAALAVRLNGNVWDLARPLPDGAKVTILTDKDPQALEVLRHSSAHVLATAVRQLFPRAQIGFGPPIEDGFYYDFEVERPFAPEDLEAIEKKMLEVVKADYPFVREEVSRTEAKQRFKDDPLKLERIEDLGPDEVISVYTDGPFVDLCRGPHVPSTGRIKHVKLLHAAGVALASKQRKEDAVTAAFFGEGAASQGDTHEAMNFAGVHKLAVVFVCENNGYAISVPQSHQMAIQNVADRAAGYGFPGVVVDGNDVLACYEVARQAVERVLHGARGEVLERSGAHAVPATPSRASGDRTAAA